MLSHVQGGKLGHTLFSAWDHITVLAVELECRCVPLCNAKIRTKPLRMFMRK